VKRRIIVNGIIVRHFLVRGFSVLFRDRRSMKNGKPSGVLVGHLEGITYVASKGDGRYCLSNSKDQTMKLWDIR
jgi:hypothetical protein